jgi:signal transduction histidine kinase
MGVEDHFQKLADSARALTIEQLGIAVYVANEIIEVHGGRFRILGELGKEFEFDIELPFKVDYTGRRDPEKIGA